MLPLYDGASEGLNTFLELNLPYLDEVTGTDIYICDIGNPAQSGPVAKLLRHHAFAQQDKRETRRWLLEAAERGEQSLRLERMKTLIELLGIPLDQVPCIAFFPYPPWQQPAVLPVRWEWYRPDRDTRPLLQALMSWLQEFVKRDLPSQGLTNRDLQELLRIELPALSATIDDAVRAASPSDLLVDTDPIPGPRFAVYTHKGAQIVGEREYHKILRRKCKYDLLIDGLTRAFFSRGPGQNTKEGQLTPGQCGVLSELVKARKPLQLETTSTRRSLGQSDAGPKVMFNEARRSVDWGLPSGGYLMFQTRRGITADGTTYLFSPTPSMTYCLIVPLSPSYTPLQ